MKRVVCFGARTLVVALNVLGATGLANAQSGSSSDTGGGLIFFIVLLAAMAAYVAPIVIAFSRRHPNRWVIFGITIFLGGTGLGWFAALIWSLSAVHRSNDPHGSHGGESGLNITANDPITLRLEPASSFPPAIAPPPLTAPAHPLEGDLLDRLERLKRLHDAGAVDDDQFRRMRDRLVGEMG